jgi:hypothetical protein
MLRRFGFIALAGYGLLGALVIWKRGLFGFGLGAAADPLAYLLWGVGLLAACCSLVRPEANRALYVGMSLVTFPIGYVVSLVVLSLFFYGVLTPFGLALRLVGRDPLRRKLEPQAPTYWERRDAPESSERYFRQY